MKGSPLFWTLSQDFFLGYHAASRSPRKRTPAQGGGPISDDDEEGTIKKNVSIRTIRGNKELEVKNFSKTMTKKEKHLVKPPLSGVGKKARKKAGLGHMEGHGKKK